MRKRSGPKVDPCGKTAKSVLHDEDWLFKTTLWSLHDFFFRLLSRSFWAGQGVVYIRNA